MQEVQNQAIKLLKLITLFGYSAKDGVCLSYYHHSFSSIFLSVCLLPMIICISPPYFVFSFSLSFLCLFYSYVSFLPLCSLPSYLYFFCILPHIWALLTPIPILSLPQAAEVLTHEKDAVGNGVLSL